MKQSRKTNALLIGGLILILLLFFANKIMTKPNSQAAGDTVNPAVSPSPDYGATATHILSIPTSIITLTYVASLPKFPTIATTPTVPIPPTATSTLQPPACTFPLVNVKYPESKPEEYTFSEPQVVLTAPQGNIYNIAEWLPDNQQVLITEALRNGFVMGNDNSNQESISLYNPETGESNVYAIRQETHQIPAWHPKLNAVVYPVMNYFDIDRKNQTYKFSRELWISYGNPADVQMLANNLPQLPFAIKPGGNEMVYLSDKELSKRDQSLKELSPVPVDPARWDYGNARRNNQPVSYNMAWQPGTPLIFLYSDGVMGGGGYTFMLNTDTGHICELNLGGWAAGAHWSSDGRYLAVGRATSSHPADLTLLDTLTGNLTTLNGAPDGMQGQLYLNDFIWSPDNHHLLAIGSVISPTNSQGNIHGLYFVDIASGRSIYVAEYKSIISMEDNNWAWSSDGSKLLARCPTQLVDQICLISIQEAGQ